ncbi:Imm53 family immunity protein [Myxococcus dinghuensis]|uniref:Imm53 family immunity protein n=1 Tax=Myxococcus dinghuensis TaxID=2906761 RepID=UPI0038990D59
MNQTTWLATWFRNQCNGNWEHTRGISITTIDNPGWLVTVDLQGTTVESRSWASRTTRDCLSGKRMAGGGLVSCGWCWGTCNPAGSPSVMPQPESPTGRPSSCA